MSAPSGQRPDAEALRIARLLRVAREEDFSKNSREGLWQLLLRELDAPLPRYLDSVPGASKVLATKPEASGTTFVEPVVDLGLSPQPQGTEKRQLQQFEDDHSKLEMRLRKMVEAEAPWTELGPLALEYYQIKGGELAASRVLELAYLSAKPPDVEALLIQFYQDEPGFWRHVHPAVRSGLCTRLWRQGGCETLSKILFRDQDDAYLLPVEKLWVFWMLRQMVSSLRAYEYVQQHRDVLLMAVTKDGPKLGMGLGRFCLEMGRLCLAHHDVEAAVLALELIDKVEPEHDEALRLLLDVSTEKSRHQSSHYAELLRKASSDDERLRLLSRFVSETRGLGGFRDRNRPALNEILRQPLEFLASEPATWRELSLLLLSARDLLPLLPNLFEVFRVHAKKFLEPVLDGSLWHGPCVTTGSDPLCMYWRGVALLHHYVQCGAGQEDALWQARQLIIEARRLSEHKLPFEWKELHREAYTYIGKNHYLIELDRERMLRQMRIAKDASLCTTADVDDYLRSEERPSLAVLDSLKEHVREKKDPALEARLIEKRASWSHLTNADLERMWQLAGMRRDFDLSWRVATLLHARLVLAPQVRHAWEISGEKRSSYPLQQVPYKMVEAVLKGMEKKGARLCHALLRVGSRLPELLFLLDRGASATSHKVHAPDTALWQVEKALDQLGYLVKPKARYRYSFEVQPLATPLPQMVAALPNNPWSIILAKITERLGAPAFAYRLSLLSSQIESLVPRLAGRDEFRARSGKVAGWLRSLSPEQRLAWQDLASLGQSLSDEEAANIIVGFAVRLAVLIYQNHYMALISLQTMRVPVQIIWDAERFILSSIYGEMRRHLKSSSRVPVPNALQRMLSIVYAEPKA